MEQQQLLIIGAGFIALASLAGMAWGFFNSRKRNELHALFRASRSGGGGLGEGVSAEVRARVQGEHGEEELVNLKKFHRKQLRAKQKSISMEEKYFHAGIFSEKDRREFERLKYLIPALTGPAFGIFGLVGVNAEIGLYGLVVGMLVGLKMPSSIIERKIVRRAEDIMFYLPLVIEQVAIGVSSSLDIGPCLQRVVAMADERDSHNVVTELVRHAQAHVKSGVSLEEALVEVGTKSGHTELKHAFMALAQVAKHGGEISKQLQELADAVASQRETKIDAKIKKLELEATGPVAMVFLGFILILLIGFAIQIKQAFG